MGAKTRWFLCALFACGSQEPAPCPGPDGGPTEPPIAVGYDAYRAWDSWPNIRLNTRTYMRSTYDRSGGNESADASHFIRIENGRAIPLDVLGPGVLYFARANHWHGSPWHYTVDGTDHVVTESATATPNAPPMMSTFTPGDVFAPPLSLTWSLTHGADLLAAPIPFATSLELGYERTHYGTGYFIYEIFPNGAPIASWKEEPLPQDVAALVNRAGQDIAPNDASMKSIGGTTMLSAGSATTLFDATGPASIRAFTLTVAQADAAALGGARLRITWDNRSTPSIDAPVSLFFGTGSLFNRMSREWLVQAFPVSVHFVNGTIVFATYFPMPFSRAAHVEIVNPGANVSVQWSARTAPRADPQNWAGYLHATYVDQGTPTPGVDLTLLDTTKTEGGGDWCGSFVGTSFIFSDRAVLTTLEGDPRFFFDDSLSPQVQGTGTEEWAGGGDYWGGLTSTLPFYGHPVGAPDPMSVMGPGDEIESAYRFLLADRMPFGKNARIELEHGGINDSTEHYQTVAYWYGLPGSCLVQTDALHVSDTGDEKAHRYAGSSAVDSVTSSYEWGAPSSDTGRHGSSTIEMSFAIAPQNFGVMLRRKLDLSFADQRAEIYVAPDDGGTCTTFAHAGTWYTAGSNSCVYSNPPGELDPLAPIPETFDKRWHDDEFLIARALTDGHSRIRVRIVPKTAWSEYRYTIYSWALPAGP